MDKICDASDSFKNKLCKKVTYANVKSQNGPMTSENLAPVHSPISKAQGLSRVQKMESGSKMTNDLDSINNSLRESVKEKLTVSKKSNVTKFGKNGIKMGTTDAEVYDGPQPNNVNKVSFSAQEPSEFCKTPCLASFSHAQLSCLSSQDRKNCLPTSSKHCVNNPISATCIGAINPICSFKPDPLCFKPDLSFASNGNLCNGHTVSEATSSTNSLAISDLSISSEKSTSLDSSYSYSGARPRKKENSNSSSQSLQPYSSECEIGLSTDLSLITTGSTTSSSYTSKVGLLEEKNVGLIEPSNLLSSPRKEEYIHIEYINYENENQMESIMHLIQKDLSEPYSIYTYRYFIHNWPKLCILALHEEEVVGAIVCKLDVHKKSTVRGYIAMLAVDKKCRKRRIGSSLVQRAIREMTEDDADEVVLETEITNEPALKLYENLGFVRDKRLFRYYLNGVDALRLKLWLR